MSLKPQNLMPPLSLYSASEALLPLGIDPIRVPRAANEIAAVLAEEQLDLRSAAAALSHVLGWLAFQLGEGGGTPEDFANAVAEQTINYYREFARLGRAR